MSLRGALIACAVLAATPAPSTFAQNAAALSPRNANYKIVAHLEPRTRTITASEVITWRNITHVSTSELRFHLYWNAWADTKSTLMRERARSAPDHTPAADFAQLSVDSIRLADAGPDDPSGDLTPSRRFIAPDDGNADDRTVMVVPLPRPVAPGESTSVVVKWSARVPRPFDRTGAIGKYFFIAQWFPKLGVLEDSGWNCHQFHSQTEFFSDYGVYDVEISVPSGWVVGATGVEAGRSDSGGVTTHRYVQEDVHDFAWTTSPHFVVRTARFEEPGLPAVDMRLLMQPEHTGQEERHFAAARSALRRYGSWFGPYPFGHLTIVDPAWQSDTGGMEYPTLITAGTQWLISRQVTYSTPEEVVTHEAGHQFWYGIVGNNEFEHAWMDEGINTFATGRAMAVDYPPAVLDRYYFGGFIPWTFRDVRLARETDYNRLWDFRVGATEDTMSGLSYRQRPRTVRFFAYDKPAVWLNTMERWLGWPIVQQALSATFRDGAFNHPSPELLLDHLQRASGRDLSRFFDQTYRGSAVFDYAVTELSSESHEGHFETRAVIRRLGDGVFPVDVLVTFENGDTITEPWAGEERWRELVYTRRTRARSVVVDPQRQLLLDVNFTNNSRTLAPRSSQAARKWTLKWIVWLQDAMLSWGLFA
jgi:hypothetical protein